MTKSLDILKSLEALQIAVLETENYIRLHEIFRKNKRWNQPQSDDSLISIQKQTLKTYMDQISQDLKSSIDSVHREIDNFVSSNAEDGASLLELYQEIHQLEQNIKINIPKLLKYSKNHGDSTVLILELNNTLPKLEASKKIVQDKLLTLQSYHRLDAADSATVYSYMKFNQVSADLNNLNKAWVIRCTKLTDEVPVEELKKYSNINPNEKITYAELALKCPGFATYVYESSSQKFGIVTNKEQNAQYELIREKILPIHINGIINRESHFLTHIELASIKSVLHFIPPSPPLSTSLKRSNLQSDVTKLARSLPNTTPEKTNNFDAYIARQINHSLNNTKIQTKTFFNQIMNSLKDALHITTTKAVAQKKAPKNAKETPLQQQVALQNAKTNKKSQETLRKEKSQKQRMAYVKHTFGFLMDHKQPFDKMIMNIKIQDLNEQIKTAQDTREQCVIELAELETQKLNPETQDLQIKTQSEQILEEINDKIETTQKTIEDLNTKIESLTTERSQVMQDKTKLQATDTASIERDARATFKL